MVVSEEPIKINKKIVGYSVTTPEDEATEERRRTKEFNEDVKRPEKLTGNTYKIEGDPYSIYVTINDIEHEGEKRPFEIFIKTDCPENAQWTAALSRILSALLRKSGKFQFIADELRQVHSPKGGQWIKGKYIPSNVAMIGEVIERHFVELGYKKENAKPDEKKDKVANVDPSSDQSMDGSEKNKPTGSQCPECKEFTLVKNDGCVRCTSCGYLGECG
jgi:ribonucleoside-diphosphate reductase alpha chain